MKIQSADIACAANLFHHWIVRQRIKSRSDLENRIGHVYDFADEEIIVSRAVPPDPEGILAIYRNSEGLAICQLAATPVLYTVTFRSQVALERYDTLWRDDFCNHVQLRSFKSIHAVKQDLLRIKDRYTMLQ